MQSAAHSISAAPVCTPDPRTSSQRLAQSLRDRAWTTVGVSPAEVEKLRREHAQLRANGPDAALQSARQILDIRARRRLMQAIAAAYGRMHHAEKESFLWMGFAAIAVNDGVIPTTDLALSAARLLNAAAEKAAGLGVRVAGLAEDGIKAAFEANFAIFDDLYWVHLAYLEGGLLRLRALYRDGALARDLLDGFTLIDSGRQEPDPCAAERLSIAGNLLLFQHEQRVSVTPVFGKYRRALRAATGLGLISLPNRELRMSCERLGRSAAFVTQLRGPDYGPFAARWEWLKDCGWEALLSLRSDERRGRPILTREVHRAISGQPEGALGHMRRLLASLSA
jgi:hypothetical protein